MAVIRKESFGTLRDGRSVELYTLRNTKGTEVKIITYGARLISWRFMTRKFEFVNVLQGYPELSSYEEDTTSRGAVANDAGEDGSDFGHQLWKAEETYEGLRLTLGNSPEEGGLRVSVLYGLSNDNELSIRYEAETEEERAWDLTGHVRFCLAGAEDADSVKQIQFFADASEERDEGRAVEWILRDKPAEVEMELGMFGYDPGCPIDYLEGGLKNGAEIRDEKTGILLQTYTTLPRLRFCGTPGHENGETRFETRGSFSLTAQSAPGARLKKGETWKAQTIYVLKAK